MPLTLASNIVALSVQRKLGKTSDSLGQTFIRLATGLRVNSAKDDAGSIGIATRLTSKIQGLSKAAQNTNDGISLAQVADDALVETVNAMQRIRDLAVEAKGGTKSLSDRQTLQTEVEEMITEIDRIASGIKFNGLRLLAGSFTAMTFQIGADAGNTLAVTFAGASTNKVGLGLAGNSAQVSTITQASRTILLIDSALDSVSSIRATIGGVQNRFESIANQIQSLSDNYTSARSTIMDANVAKETADMTRNLIIKQAGISVLAQANLQPQLLLQLLRSP
ncbi:MAG: flagellin FliC [Magnetococcales bacterium]|nr:flagellin FliC [Magnetococcales bacterium]MBF0150715.1 flagellin FliC [Magnetococcales bacterium]MBF0174428.1 flagellin FliC [Magnetococcales bacterium]MBF0631669.1 flagellin FliC [Magnetococcales bacterium]